MTVKKINGYRILLAEKLGKGAFGAVYKAESDSKKIHAIKVIDKRNIMSDPYLKAALISEIKIMKTVHSENIVSLVDVLESSNNFYIIQELCDGDLQHLLKAQPNRCLDEKTAVRFLTEICNGFMTLVREGIVHRDLKPANILMSKGKIKIGDFGFAKKNANHKLKNQTTVGTPLYMPIELLKGQPYTSKCDIWAIGFIFYEMLHGHTPWTAKSQFQLINNILNRPLKISKVFSSETMDFLQKTLTPLEKNRISWDQLFKHPIFNGYFQVYTEQNEKLENVYKKVMGDLRFKINSQNIHLKKLWKKLGYSEDKELNWNEFVNFLRLIHPEMVATEEQFFFEKMDKNGDGRVSLREVSEEFENYNIPLSSIFAQKIPFFLEKLAITDDQKENNPKNCLNAETEKRISNCFLKLHNILQKKNITLCKVFNAYDGDKNGELSLFQFSKIIKRIDPTFLVDEIEAVFRFLDNDNSETIEFDELNQYYCKVNGVPEAFQIPKQFLILKNQKKSKQT